MVFLRDVLDTSLMYEMVRDGYIREQDHPTAPYTIYNYTEKTTFDRKWNEATLQCRGLILNHHTKEVVARPFKKFFNWGENGETHKLESYRNSPVTVTDKLDGSLGILYPLPNGDVYAIATRGSFTSPQAIHATERLQSYISEGFSPLPSVTYLFEIIYPDNRIVCNYYGMDELVLLGSVSTEYGYSTGPQSCPEWNGPCTKVFAYTTFQQALDAQHRKGAEGLVVHFADRDTRIKLKQPDYVLLHRIVTGLNERRVWELMASGTVLEDIQKPLPEEFHPWVEEVYKEIQKQWYAIWWDAHKSWQELGSPTSPTREARAELAKRATKMKNPHLIFQMMDAKDVGDAIWKMVKPAYTRGPWSQTEDAN